MQFSLKFFLVFPIYTEYALDYVMRRGAVTKKNSKMINIWVPTVLVPVIDAAVVKEDTDRAKYIRRAIREKLVREGIPLPSVE
jgi:hypothetical protein